MSNIVENNIVLDLNRSAIQTIYAKQYDNNTREIKIEIVNQGKHVGVKSLGYLVYFKGITSTGKQLLNRCEVDNNDIIHLELTSTILHDNGHLNGEIILLDSNSGSIDPSSFIVNGANVVSTMPFILHVKSSAFQDGDISEEEYSVLNDLIVTVSHLEDEVEDNEEERQSNEQERISNEINRNNAENVRKSNENTRIANENTRISNENTRKSNETTRQSNEQTRQTNESTRQTNETSRIETMEQIETDLQTLEDELDTVVLKRQLGVPSTSTETGVATLDTNGQVPESQLPSYVDDVLEGRAQNVTQSASGAYSATAFILKGESTACIPEEDKIYIDTTDLIQYRWSGSVFVSVGSHLALGETSSTAFPGNRGKAIEDDYLSKTGNANDTTVTFTESTTRANITSGEKASVLFGKIKKFFADLKTVAFTGNASDVSFDNTGTASSSTTVQAGLVEALTATGFANNGTTTETDMDNVVSFGSHTINPSVTTLNVPVSGTWGSVEVFRHGTKDFFQLWVSLSDNSMYTRTKSGSPAVWSSWRGYEQLVTFSDLSKYGIAVSGEKINATLQEICKKVPIYCEVKISWTGNQQIEGTYRFGTIGQQLPESYGSLYIRRNGINNPCIIEFIPYSSGNHYMRNYDYINAEHLSDWQNLLASQTYTPGNVPLNTLLATNGTVRYTQETIAKTEGNSTSSQAYSSGQYMIRDGNLKKVTRAIARGESITGNNTSNTTVGEELRNKISKFANGVLAGWSSYYQIPSTSWGYFCYGPGILYSGYPAMSLLTNHTFRVTIYCNIQCTSDTTLAFAVSLKNKTTSDTDPFGNTVTSPGVATKSVIKAVDGSGVGITQKISASCIIQNITTIPTGCLYYAKSNVSNAIKINNIYALWEIIE